MKPLNRNYKPTGQELEGIKSRLAEYASVLGLSQSQFCIEAGLERTYFHSFTGNPTPATKKTLAETYPALNMDWLFYGIGSMINEGYEDNQHVIVSHRKPSKTSKKQEEADETVSSTVKAIDTLIAQLEAKDKLIEFLMERIKSYESDMAKAKGIK